ASGEFNDDAQVDLALGNCNDVTVSILLGKGDGTFQPPVKYNCGNPPGFVAVGDFNMDGRPDLAVAQFSGSQPGISILLGNGDGTFQPGVYYAAGGGAKALVVADFNSDGKPDLAVGD